MDAEERLLDALREQMVAGQVETLLSLETSSAILRTEAKAVGSAGAERLREVTEALAQVQGLTADFAGSAQKAAEYLAAAAREALVAVVAQIDARAEQTVQRVEGHTAAAERSLADAVLQAADDLSHRVETSLLATTRQVDDAAAALARATQSAVSELAEAQRTVVDAIVEASHVADIARARLAEQVARAGEAVRAAGQEVSTAVESSTKRLLEELLAERREWAGVLSEGVGAAEHAAAAMAEQVAAAGARTAERVGLVGEGIVASLNEEASVLTDQAASFAINAETLLQRWEKRDARRDARVEERVSALLERVEAGWRELAVATAREAARRDARELAQEKQRAEEFAGVLSDVLGRAGAPTRGLRSRVLRGLDEGRAVTVMSPPPAEPVVEHPAEPPVRRRRKAATKDSEETS